jgi:Nitrile hydratase, alpha chain
MEGAEPQNELHERRREHTKDYGRLVARAWSDPKFKQRLISDPARAFEEHGIELPRGVQVRVVENTDEVAYYVLPRRPGEDIVSDEMLAQAMTGERIMFTSSGGECTVDRCDCSGDLCCFCCTSRTCC